MKILVVSLLRLGDVIQQKPLLRSLHDKHPGAKVHLLINKQFADVASLISKEVEKIHHFDRELLQRSMGESSFNLFTPLAILDQLIQDIQAENYDLVLNWTHNKLSAFFVGALQIPHKQGLHIQEGKLLGLDSLWLKYFNDNFAEGGKSFFHYIELLGNAFDLPVEKYSTRPLIGESRTVYFQCLTSDTKKNWSMANFAELKHQIEQRYPDFPVRILASEKEFSQLRAFFEEQDILVCDLVEARNLLAAARALVACDTSIKHLAAEVGTPVLEISLGGSDARKTAAYVRERVLLAGQSACYPCTHSQKCSQKSHLCGDSVSVETAMEAFTHLLEGGGTPVTHEDEIERAIWKSYLNQSEPQMSLSVEEAQQLLQKTEILLRSQLDFESCENFNQIFSSLQVIAEQKLDTGAYFQKLSQVFKDRYANAESAFSALKKALEQSQALLQVRLTLINQSLSKDGGNYAERT